MRISSRVCQHIHKLIEGQMRCYIQHRAERWLYDDDALMVFMIGARTSRVADPSHPQLIRLHSSSSRSQPSDDGAWNCKNYKCPIQKLVRYLWLRVPDIVNDGPENLSQGKVETVDSRSCPPKTYRPRLDDSNSWFDSSIGKNTKPCLRKLRCL